MTDTNVTSLKHKLEAWISDRLGLPELIQLAQKKKVPMHRHSLWYYMGGVAGMLLGVQVVTGILLAIYYIPELESAYASILKLNTQVAFGWFNRSMHSWGANLMILVLFFHLFSAFFMKAYRPPREITWWSGCMLLLVVMGFGFTGYLLPWDEISFFATKIGLDIADKTPVVGHWLANMLRGGPDISQATLSRFFVIHVFVLPLAVGGLLGLHLFMIQQKGISEPKSFAQLPESEKRYEPFFPTFALKDAMVWLLAFNVLAALVTLVPWGLGHEADPFAPAPIGIKPEWYFLAMFQFLKLLPAQIGPIEGELFGILCFGLIGAVLFFAPLLDPVEGSRWGKWLQGFGTVVLIGFTAFTIWGLLA